MSPPRFTGEHLARIGKVRVPAMVGVCAGAVVLSVLHVLWLARFRWGYVTDWDEAGYIAIALNASERIAAGLHYFYGGVAQAFASQPHALPLSAALPVPARSFDAVRLVERFYYFVPFALALCLPRRFMPPRWAALAALGVGTASLVSVYFPVPAGTQGPVVPLSAVPLLATLGRSVDVAQLVELPYFVLLVLATYGLARRLMPTWWAALAALAVGTAPVVSDYSRLVHFGVPAAALLTSALWALSNSEALRQTRWVIGGGVLLALTVLARSMTVSYMPGVALGVGIPLLVQGEDRQMRLRNFLLLWLTAGAIAAVWYVPNFTAVSTYLTSAAYGSPADAFGVHHSILSLGYWTKELWLVGNYLYLPLSAALVACLAAAAVLAMPSAITTAAWRASVRRWTLSDEFLLTVVVVGGYLALTSTTNEGTAFSLPWLPSLIVLATAAAASIRVPAVRAGLAVLLVAVCVLNAAVKNGISSRLSQPVSMHVPLVGTVTVLDGRDPIYASLDELGYPARPPPARLPALHRHWSAFNDRVVRFMNMYAAERGYKPSVMVGTGDWLINETRIRLAGELAFRRKVPTGMLAGGPDTVDFYQGLLQSYGYNFLVTSDPPRVPRLQITRATVETAAQQIGFRRVGGTAAPDGRRVVFWWRAGAPA